MGGAACVIIINGNRAYGVVEDFAETYKTVNVNMLEAAIEASCSVTPYTSLYLQGESKELENQYTQPIIDLHNRIINELPVVEKANAQVLVDQLTDLLFLAAENLASSIT